MRRFACSVAQAPFLISGFGIVASIAVICIERALATFFEWHSDDYKSTKSLRLVVAGGWLAALLAVAVSLAATPDNRHDLLWYCHAVLSIPRRLLYSLIGICIVVDISALVLCILVLIWNHHQLNSFGINLAKRHSLAQRFQGGLSPYFPQQKKALRIKLKLFFIF